MSNPGSPAAHAPGGVPKLSAEQVGNLEKLLGTTLAPDNNARNQAMKMIETHYQQNREFLVLGLVQLLRSSQRQDVRNLCAVHLRKRLPQGEPMLFDKLPEGIQTIIKTELLKAIVEEKTDYLRRQVADTVSELSQILIYRNEWPELLVFLPQLCKHQSPAHRICSQIIIGKIADDAMDQLQPHINLIVPMLQAGLADESAQVRVASCVAVCTMVVNIDEDKIFEGFQGFIPMLMKVLGTQLNQKDFDGANKILRCLVEIATHVSIYFKPKLEEVSHMLVQIGKTQGLDGGLRRMVLSFHVHMCVDCAQMVRASPTVIPNSINLAMALMLDVEDDPQWGMKTDPEMEIANAGSVLEDDNFSAGQLGIDRICQHIGKMSVAVVFPIIQQFVAHQDWRFRHAGLMALSQVGETMKFNDIPIAAVLRFLQDPHPRVVYAALHCIGQLCTDHNPQMQNRYHREIMKGVVGVMSTTKLPRLQAHALACIFNFAEDCEEQVLTPYVDGMMAQMLALLTAKDAHRMVQEQVLTTVASIAGSGTDAFLKHYDKIVPFIKMIIKGAAAKSDAGFRARAMEAVTFIGVAVGRDKFRNDAREVMEMFVGIMRCSEMKSDDVTVQYLMQSWTRLCSVLREEFLPALPIVMPMVLKFAGTKCDMRFLDRDQFDDPTTYRLASDDFYGSIEEKVHGISMLTTFLHHLKGQFVDYLERTTNIILDCTDFYVNDEIREYAISAAPNLVESAHEALIQGRVTQESVKSLYMAVLGKLVECTSKENNAELSILIMESIRGVVEMAPDVSAECYDPKHMDVIVKALLNLMDKSLTRIKKRETKKMREKAQLDEDSLGELEMRIEHSKRLNYLTSDTLGAFIRVHQQKMLAHMQPVVERLMRMITSKDVHAMTIAIFVFDDIIEHGGVQAAPLYASFMPLLVQCTGHPNVEVRQAAVYGLGQGAEHGLQHFAPFAAQSSLGMLKAVRAALNCPPSEKAKEAAFIDNVVSSLGKLCKFQSAAVRNDQLIEHWFNMLPLRCDEDEGPFVYGYLCELVAAKNPIVLGKNNSNLPKLFTIFGSVLNTEFVDMETEQKILMILKVFKSIPQAQMQQVMKMQSPEVVEKLRQAFNRM